MQKSALESTKTRISGRDVRSENWLYEGLHGRIIRTLFLHFIHSPEQVFSA